MNTAITRNHDEIDAQISTLERLLSTALHPGAADSGTRRTADTRRAVLAGLRVLRLRQSFTDIDIEHDANTLGEEYDLQSHEFALCVCEWLVGERPTGPSETLQLHLRTLPTGAA